MVSADNETAVSASISTPVFPVSFTVALIVMSHNPVCGSGSRFSVKLMSTCVRARGWHMGIRSEVFFAPMIPAT